MCPGLQLCCALLINQDFADDPEYCPPLRPGFARLADLGTTTKAGSHANRNAGLIRQAGE